MKSILRFIRLWPEVWSIALAMLAWHFSPQLLHSMDPTAATYDAGILQNILFTGIAVVVFNGMVFLAIKFNFPGLWKFYRDINVDEFSSKLKMQLLCFVFAVYFIVFALCFKVL